LCLGCSCFLLYLYHSIEFVVKRNIYGQVGAGVCTPVGLAQFLMPKSCLTGVSVAIALSHGAGAIAMESVSVADVELPMEAVSVPSAERPVVEKVGIAVSPPETVGLPIESSRRVEALKQPVLARDMVVVSQAALLAEVGQVSQAPVLPSPQGDVPQKPVTPEAPGVPAPAKTSPIAPVTRAAGSMSVNLESYYYNWNDELGNRGNQVVMPLTGTYSKGNFDLGLRTAYIRSQFRGNLILDNVVIGSRQGDVSTWSDTSLSMAYTLKQSRVPVRFNLDVNVPTGKATLKGDEKNAIMDGALVQQTRFGEGWNFAPGVSVSYALSPKDVVGVGLSHIFRGRFDPNGDVVNDEINPGNETVATLQYQRSGKRALFMGGLIYTHYGRTTRGGEEYYRTGDRLDVNGTGVLQLSQGSRLQLSGRYFTQARNNVVNFFTGSLQKEEANSNGRALYLSADLGVATDRRQRGSVHLLADYLTVKANSYDPINDLFNAGRRKVSVGVGYEYGVTKDVRASVQAKYFWLKDMATPVTQQDVRSNGVNLYASLNYNF
jgi:hypothetical protein